MLAIRQKEETHVARWLPLGAGVLFALMFARELPALRRYLELRSMQMEGARMPGAVR